MEKEVVQEIYREWSRLKDRNPAFSLRAFSKKIDVPHSALSEIFNGKRRLSKKMAHKILEKLNLAEETHQQLMEKIDSTHRYDLIDLQNFKIISHWEHLAILNLLKLKDFIFCPVWISKRLGISKAKVEKSLERLYSSKMLTKNDDGSVQRSNNGNFKTPTDIKDMALQTFTKESFEMGIESLQNTDISKRDFSTVTLTVNQKDIPKAKKLIEEFRYKFDKEIETVPGDELYKLVVGFYPLTKEISDE